MTPERWQRVKELFETACERLPAERCAFLAQACEDDEEVRREVESLLRAHERDSGFMNTPVGSLLFNESSALIPGQSFGQYEQIAPLGKGGMGQVYLAVDTRLGRKIALKLLPFSYTHDLERVRRFEQEARAASALNHPNIITIHEIGQTNALHFIATEFVDGETLREHMSKKRMATGEILDVSIQIASALQAAHEAGITHRDIKPDNIMLRRDGIVKVLDFGLAKLSPDMEAIHSQAQTKPMVNTNPGVVMGTVAYMSPEQARGTKVDMRTDLWSLGVILYEMVSGRAPFVGETPSHVIVSIFESEPPPLSTAADVPDEFQRIVSRALSKNREHRYQTAEEFLIDLKRLRQRMELEVALEHAPEPSGTNKEGSPTKVQYSAVATDDVKVERTSSRVAHLANTFKVHKAVWVVASVLFIISVFAYGFWRYELKSRKDTIHSIAVLPFENQTNDPDSDYLSDGISESLINNLSQMPLIKVSARSSSFKYRGKSVDLAEAAKALGVEAILTGRILQRGDNLVISVELMDARDQTQLWGEQYNRKLADVLVVQSAISNEIVQRLRVHLGPNEQQQFAKRETVNLQAYELFLKGRFTWDKGGTENRKKAVDFYQQAITVDPRYALAYAELSRGYDTLITNNELNPKEFASKAEAAARKAIELDANLAEGHQAMARVRMSAWDWAAAELEIKRAIELNPNLVLAHGTYAIYLIVHGKRGEAVAQLNQVRELDPLSLSAKLAVLTSFYIFRQHDQALEVTKKILEADRNNADSQIGVGDSYLRLGRHREAITAFQEAIKLGDDSPDAQNLLASAYARNGEHENARAIIQRFESGKEYCSPVGLATVYVALNDRDRAFAALEAAYAAHDQQLIWLRVAWEFDELHSDPRFQDLARRVGLLS